MCVCVCMYIYICMCMPTYTHIYKLTDSIDTLIEISTYIYIHTQHEC